MNFIKKIGLHFWYKFRWYYFFKSYLGKKVNSRREIYSYILNFKFEKGKNNNLRLGIDKILEMNDNEFYSWLHKCKGYEGDSGSSFDPVDRTIDMFMRNNFIFQKDGKTYSSGKHIQIF